MSHLLVIALLAPQAVVHALVQAVVEAEKEGPGATPYLVGGGVLVLLFGSMLALLAFGKGREHS